MTAADVVAAARLEIGYTESPADSNCQRFAAEAGHVNCRYWCASFVVAIFNRVGVALPPGADTASTRANLAAFRHAGRFIAPADIIAGDVVFFHTSNRNGPDPSTPTHTGIATGPTHGGHVPTVDGNTSSDDAGDQENGGGVFPKNRSLGVVIGAGRPDYATAPVAADESELADMARLMHYDGADYLVGYDGATGEPWRRTIPNPSREAQLVGGGGIVTNNGGTFPVMNDQFLLVYADRGPA